MALPKINWKKFGLILGFILVVLFLAFIIYYFFFRPLITPSAPTPAPVTPVTPTLPPTTIITPPGAVVTPPVPGAAPTPIPPGSQISATATAIGFTAASALISNPTQGLAIASNGRDAVYYEKTSGKFFRLDSSGQTTALTDKTFYNLNKINWAPNTSRAILEYQDGSKVFYDFDTKEQVAIPRQWKDFSFSPDSTKIAFKEMNFDPDNRWVSIANPNGSGLQAVEHLGTQDSDVLVTWSPSNQVVALFRQSVNANQALVYFIGLHEENFKSLKAEGRDLRAIWSPDGSYLLYSVYSFNSNYNPSIWSARALGDTIGEDKINFKLATWADKCAFADNTTVYCAVPKTMDNGTGYFPDLANNTPDIIYKLNLATGAKARVAEPLGGYTISSLTVSKDQKSLYFTDKATGSIYKIDL